MTVRDTIATMLSYLRVEQRGIPYAGGADFDDPLPDALASCNAALQQMALLGPLFAAKQQRSAWFHAPATLTVTGLTRGGTTATGTFPAWAAGCQILLPGESEPNRILSLSSNGGTATLQFPYLADSSSGTATLKADSVELPPDIITVLEPVRLRGSTRRIVAVSSREELAENSAAACVCYFIESTLSGGRVCQRLMLNSPAATDMVLEFQARCALGQLTTADVYTSAPGHPDPGVPLPVPAGFVESIFLPLALDVFFSKPSITNYDIPSLRNQDAPSLIHQQAQLALTLLQNMRPQGHKPVRLAPEWSSRGRDYLG